MKIPLQFFRLYYIWFALGWAAGLWAFFKTSDVSIAILAKSVVYPAIYYLNVQSLHKYAPYFQNQGYSATKLFVLISLSDLFIFGVLFSLIKATLYA